jgi:uncharacterized membrane protein
MNITSDMISEESRNIIKNASSEELDKMEKKINVFRVVMTISFSLTCVLFAIVTILGYNLIGVLLIMPLLMAAIIENVNSRHKLKSDIMKIGINKNVIDDIHNSFPSNQSLKGSGQ